MESSDKKNQNAAQSQVEEGLNAEYIDRRKVTISLVKNYSNYRRVNFKTLGHKKETIGSSVRSSQILSSNANEVNTYFPALIGIAATHPDFITRVKAWLNNIQVVIGETDKVLDISFVYNKKSDYLDIKAKEDSINRAYDEIDRNNIAAIKEGLKRKLDALNALEGSKYQFGHPVNIEEYLIYRHCLLYNDVAKDNAIINSDANIRFYIKDEAKELERQKRLTNERIKAMKTFVELNGTASEFNSVFVEVIVFKGENLNEALLKDRNQRTAILMEFVNTNPDKFNKIVADKHVQIKAFIETLIARGELVRSEFNQQISTADGVFIGANMNEAIAWLENPKNKDVKEAFENKLKMYNNL